MAQTFELISSSAGLVLFLMSTFLIFGSGAAMLAYALHQFISNPHWGSYVDTEKHVFVWWDESWRRKSGSIKLSELGRIYLDNGGDSDEVRIYDVLGNETRFGGAKVVPSDMRGWVKSFEARVSHIVAGHSDVRNC